MTPISEKDTIYEQTQKATLQSALKYGEESKKSMQITNDERKLTGTGQYSFKNKHEETYADDDFYEEDFEDVNNYCCEIISIV
jgi:phosphoenolpyruvate carboxylase